MTLIEKLGELSFLELRDGRLHSEMGEDVTDELLSVLEQPAQQEPVAWRELCRRLYFELYWCDRQMMETLDENGEPMWTQGKTVRDVLADAKAALETSPPAQQEPVALQWLAEMIMSDCGCSTNNQRLLARVMARIDQYERANTTARQEPFGYFRYDLRLDAWVQNREGRTGTPFYTSPQPSKPWVGLTTEEKKEIERLSVYVEGAIRHTEAKLREKNA